MKKRSNKQQYMTKHKHMTSKTLLIAIYYFEVAILLSERKKDREIL